MRLKLHLLLAVGVTIFLFGVGLYIDRRGFDRGYDNAMVRVMKKTEEMADVAEKGRIRAMLCDTAGGVWNTATGKCSGVEENRRQSVDWDLW